MKILFFLINMNLGGTERAFLNYLQQLPKDTEVDVLLLEKKGSLLSEVPDNVNIFQIENADIINEYIKLGAPNFIKKQFKKGDVATVAWSLLAFSLYKFGLSKNYFLAIKKYLKKQTQYYNTAIAYAGHHDFISYYTIFYTKADKKWQWLHFDVNKIPFNTAFYKRIFKYFDQINCVSRQVAGHVKEKLQSFESKIKVVPNTVNRRDVLEKAAAFQVNEMRDEYVNILTVGRLSQEKGHVDFMPLFEKLKQHKIAFKWWIVGDGSSKKSLEQSIQKYGLSDEICLLGSQANPYPFFKNCDIYLQPSKYEGHCVAILEAKVFSKPILCNDFAGARDEIKEGKNGYICSDNLNDRFEKMMLLIKANNKR